MKILRIYNCCNICNFFKIKTKRLCQFISLYHKSLFYNHFTSVSTIFDTALEPLFWFVDNFVRYLGPAFVTLVVTLTFSVVIIFYICLVPVQYEQSLLWTIIHLAVGHYFLLCITYHYFKAAFTDPGSPPDRIEEAVSICKLCIGPKPPRAHHCSVCKRCILKMDHHCPWLNNCVGHYNQRNFFLFCMYMWIGTVYVSYVAYPMFKTHFYGEEDPGPSGLLYPIYLIKRAWKSNNVVPTTSAIEGDEIVLKSDLKQLHNTAVMRDTTGLTLHTFIVYEFMLCSAVSVALGLLVLWQCRLISYGETSIEWHINKREKARLHKQGQIFKNPYDFGFKRNWYKFLGIDHKNGSFWRDVLLPSSNPPDGDGLHWQTNNKMSDSSMLLL